jgi:hypothetical protein
MNNGILIFAHNNRDIDYALMAIISGGLAKKYLNAPVSLVTDPTTIEWLMTSNKFKLASQVFDKIISVEKPETDNKRNLYDGIRHKIVPFVNANRSSAWDMTPYDRTLLIDSDYLIFSNSLSNYWEFDASVMISTAALDIIKDDRLGYHDRYVSDTGVHLSWATTVMFTKNEESRVFFELVNFIKDNYQFYADLFRFGTTQFRNDIAFSVAKHILDGFETDLRDGLPPVLTTLDRDILQSVDSTGKLTFLVSQMLDSNFYAAAIKGLDVHVMNKQSLVRNADQLLELI